MPLPQPSEYSDWQDWASAIMRSLGSGSNDVIAGGPAGTVPAYVPPGYSPLWMQDSDGTLLTGNVYGQAPTAPDIVFIDTANIADAAIETAKIDVNAVGSLQLADLAVVTAKIADAAIVSAKIGDLQVVNAKIADLAVNNAKIANLAVDSANIMDAAINNAKIGLLAVGTANIIDAAINSAKIADASITSADIQNATITTADIGTAQITTALIANAQITNALMATASIGSAQIINASILTADIALAQITTALIANLAVTSALIANAAIGSAQIAAAAVGSAQIADAAILSAKIADAEIGTLHLAGGGVVTVPSVASGADVYIPATGAITTVLTSLNVTVGDSTYGTALITIHGWLDAVQDSGVYIGLETSIDSGGHWVQQQAIKAGARANGGVTTEAYIPFSTAFAVSGVQTIAVRIQVHSILVGTASAMHDSYVRDPVIVIQGGKR